MLAVRQIAVAQSLAAALAAAPAAVTASPVGPPTPHLFAPFTSLAAERLEVGAKTISAQPLASRLEIVLKSGTASTLAGKSTLCPRVVADAETPTLRCNSTRFAATLEPKSGAVTIVELRGLPWRPGTDGPPLWAYNPDALDKALVCPGTTAIAQAECDYQSGRLEKAFAEFSAIGEGPTHGFAALRLGDIALAHDDTERALGAFDDAARPSSPMQSLALLRHCELIDECTPQILNPKLYPAPLAAEARLRITRRYAFRGDWAAVVELLQQVAADPAGPLNHTEERRLTLQLLIGALGIPEMATSADDDRLTRALEIYLNDPDRLTGDYAEQVTDAAAEAAAHLGTPRFGAHILAAVFPQVAPKRRAAHLLRTAELYLDDEDAVHAEAIIEFARTRLGKTEFAKPRWVRATKRLQQYGDHVHADEVLTRKLLHEVQLTREVTEAVKLGVGARKTAEANP